jgi:hypothetical protein
MPDCIRKNWKIWEKYGKIGKFLEISGKCSKKIRQNKTKQVKKGHV